MTKPKQEQLYVDGTCKWCTIGEGNIVCRQHVKGYICTREFMHRGPHVACGMDGSVGQHPIAIED